MMTTVSFTGHRPKELFGAYDSDNPKANQLAQKLTELIEQLIVEKKADTFVSGGALGVDQIAFMCVELLKKKYPHIRNIMAIPYKDQPLAWEENLKKAKENGWTKAVADLEKTLKRYYAMLKMADEVIYVDAIDQYKPRGMPDDQIGKHSNAKLQIRNVYMLDQCDILVAVYNGREKGGTFNCVTAAKKRNMNIVYMNPNKDFEIQTSE